jgi:hypothetical protein
LPFRGVNSIIAGLRRHKVKTGLVIVGIWSLCLFLLSSYIALFPLLIPSYRQFFYPFTLPFIIMAGECVALSAVGLRVMLMRSLIYSVVVPIHGILFLPYWFAVSRWPGGNDGGGIAWVLLIGGGSCIAGILSLVLIVIAAVTMLRTKKWRAG